MEDAYLPQMREAANLLPLPAEIIEAWHQAVGNSGAGGFDTKRTTGHLVQMLHALPQVREAADPKAALAEVATVLLNHTLDEAAKWQGKRYNPAAEALVEACGGDPFEHVVQRGGFNGTMWTTMLKVLNRCEKAGDARRMRDGGTILHHCAQTTAPWVMEDVLKSRYFHKTWLDATNHAGHTALGTLAERVGSGTGLAGFPWQKIERLLNHGADPSLVDREGCTAAARLEQASLQVMGPGEEEAKARAMRKLRERLAEQQAVALDTSTPSTGQARSRKRL